MKKVLAIIISIISCLCLFTGCKKGWYADDHAFLYKKMSELPVEYDGYYLEPCSWKDEMCVTQVQYTPSYEYAFRDGKIFVERKEDGVYTISYNNSEVVVNQSFMEEKSSIYVRINQIWVGKSDRWFSPARIIGIGVFDDKIFIVTCSVQGGISSSVRGKIPNTLYYYDIDTNRVLYCGFYSGELTSTGCYDGFIDGIDFKVNKQNLQ